MTADASSLALPWGRSRLSPTRWIQSPLFDAILFVAPGLAVLPIVLLALGVDRHFGVLFVALAFPHYMSTLAFYFWDENRPRLRAQWIAFFAGPAIIALAFTALMAGGAPKIMAVALLAWNTFHVALQNCGIASIYRHRAGVTDPLQKSATNFAIISVSAFCAIWNIRSNDAFDPLLRISPDYALYLRVGFGAVAVAALLRLAWSISARMTHNQAPTLPEALFLISALIFFHPYLWLSDNNQATAVMLLPHYLQYLGIVWLLHRRRFRNAEGSAPQRVLSVISSSTPILFGCILMLGLFIVVVSVGLRHAGRASVFQFVFMLTAFEHYYLDGLFWAFRDPTVRKTIGPYLTRYTRSVQAGT